MTRAGTHEIRHAFCPACDRYIGPADACPYCDAAAPRPLKLVRRTALLLTILGCILLVLSVRNQPVQTVPMNSIRPSMNYAYVSVSGRVERAPVIRREQGKPVSLSMTLVDQTGPLLISCSERVAAQLVAEDRVPERDDVVTVSGSLSIESGQRPILRCRSARSVTILSDEDEKR